MTLWLLDNWWWLAGLLLFIFMLAVLVFRQTSSWRISFAGLAKIGKVSCDTQDINSSSSILSNDNIIIGNKPEWLKILEEELKRIPLGRISFNPPTLMKVGVKERIEVRITKDPNIDLVANLKGRGVPKIEEIKVSELMTVRLSGRDFDICPLNEEEQVVGTWEYGEWAWDIMPRKSGNRTLHLNVTLRIRLPFGEEKKDHPVLDREVTVKINPAYSIRMFMQVHWKWIATALILPLIGLIWKIYFK